MLALAAAFLAVGIRWIRDPQKLETLALNFHYEAYSRFVSRVLPLGIVAFSGVAIVWVAVGLLGELLG
ncbi:MAG: hypothetical protein GY720_08015 [bacterium]|nr:hypothetical protein [bacterium]